jgi:Xaa-Pro dipeptidase
VWVKRRFSHVSGPILNRGGRKEMNNNRAEVMMPFMSDLDHIDPATLDPLYRAHLDTLKTRHDHALETAGASHAIVFSGAPKLRFLDDYYYPFKANPHFLAWLPLSDTPFCYLVYTPGETPVLIYYQEKDYWHTPPANPNGYWAQYFDIRVVHSLDDIAQHLPQERDKCILIGEISDDTYARGIERVNPSSVINILHYGRAYKTAYEISCMRSASRRGAKGHIAAAAAFIDGKSEYEIHLAYCQATDHTETELPYGNIVALNEHSSVLHYQHLSRTRLQDGRSFLIDAGASVLGYASDITRTYSRENDEFQSLIDRFDTLQQELVAKVIPGISFSDLHIFTHRKIAELLLEFKLASGSIDALIETDVTAAFFPHGLGHYLGIQVHDVGGFMADASGNVIDRPSGHPYLRLTRELAPGQVLTIEPGLYAIDMLQANLAGTPGHDLVNHERVQWMRPYGGIRIEDNVRVTANGCENLTRDAFAAI